MNRRAKRLAGAAALGGQVTCPVCLTPLTWQELPPQRWDPARSAYVEAPALDGLTSAQRARLERGAVVRCPETANGVSEHYLPLEYGRHGQPIVVGFVGPTSSGKTHLLAAIVGAIENEGLAPLKITSRPIDPALHNTFLERKVRPFLDDSKVLERTEERIVSFADALLIGPADGPGRVVALFDVHGAELGLDYTSQHGSKSFLEIADGFVFTADPTQFGGSHLGEDTFNTVLGVLGDAGRRRVSATVVVNKADLVRFEDPVSRWLRTDVTAPDPDLALRESADVYAFLDSRGAEAWSRPYGQCAKSTMHFVSATGGPGADPVGRYPRGVAPRRVLAPFVSLLAMTGVLRGGGAERVGA